MSCINNVDRFKQRLREGKLCVGTGVQLADPLVSEVAAEAGSDFLWIDAEHSCLGLPAVLGHIMAVRGTQAAPLVRVPYNDPNVIKPYLDMAPAGIIVPMIRSAEETRKAVAACRYPPRGVRGFGPMRNMYGKSSMTEYLETADEDIMVIAHIETPRSSRRAGPHHGGEGYTSCTTGSGSLQRSQCNQALSGHGSSRDHRAHDPLRRRNQKSRSCVQVPAPGSAGFRPHAEHVRQELYDGVPGDSG